MRGAYIAEYPDCETEIIIASDNYWSPELSRQFDEMIQTRPRGMCKVQAWYHDHEQVTLMGYIG